MVVGEDEAVKWNAEADAVAQGSDWLERPPGPY